jgi:hypothetical protein
VRHRQGWGASARDGREDEGKGDVRVLARLVVRIAMGVGLEGLQRGQDNTVLRYWSDHGCFVDNTQEGRRAMRATTDEPCLDNSARRGDWRGGATSMCGQTCNGGSAERIHGGIEIP